MGLDSVEIVMKVEQALGINIPDAETEKMVTVGHMYQYIWSRVNNQVTSDCITQKVFFRLRRQLREQLEIPDTLAIKPATKLADLIPRKGRKQKWRKLEKGLGLRLPHLHIPIPVFLLMVLSFCIVAGLSWYDAFGISKYIGYQNKLILLLPVIPVFFMTKFLFRMLKTEFVEADVRALSLKVSELNFEELAKNGVTETDVRQIIDSILVELAGVRPEEIAPEKSFVSDLGIN